MRDKYGERIDIDTCAAAFSLSNGGTVSIPSLSKYDLVKVCGIYQLNDACVAGIPDYWVYVGKSTALLLIGDKSQMMGMNGGWAPWGGDLRRRVTKEMYLTTHTGAVIYNTGP